MREKTLDAPSAQPRDASAYIDSPHWRRTPLPAASAAARCRRKFLKFFPSGFLDPKYDAWERGYKWQAHEQWEWLLDRATFRDLLHAEQFAEIAARAVRIEARTNLLSSFEKMALRDALKSPTGACQFADGLFDLLHGRGSPPRNFARWCEIVAALPRRQTRVFTWPVVTVFGFLAQPQQHILLKPKVTQAAARAYGYPLSYEPHPTVETYLSLLEFAATVCDDLRDLGEHGPRDLIDVQSFLRVLGSEEYD